ncbi:MAG: diphosphomevalonate decarboxylase [Planctomycetota bacterium]
MKQFERFPKQAHWRCPSNIAIVKYWGKRGQQLPCNSSLSMTLTNAYTETEILITDDPHEEFDLDFYFEGQRNEKFGQRVRQYIANHIECFPTLQGRSVTIRTSNSFPHSAGIASSASAFGSIALCLVDIERSDEQPMDTDFYRRASSLARLGSGSACRSMYPMYSVWGKNEVVPNSHDEFALPIESVHEVFQTMRNAIIVVDDQPKKVSSSAGHALMNNHPFATQRFDQANQRTARLVQILKQGNIDDFVVLTESEALTLHAMMMTSRDYYLLLKPPTLSVIEAIVQFRQDQKIPVCYTMDAGPNVHLLYPDSHKVAVEGFIHSELKGLSKSIHFDHIGQGPRKVNELK